MWSLQQADPPSIMCVMDSSATHLKPRPTKKKSVFVSPRCGTKDDSLFFAPVTSFCMEDERWQSISQPAANHAQDGSVLILHERTSLKAFSCGLTKYASLRVRRLDVTFQEDKLMEWMDVIA